MDIWAFFGNRFPIHERIKIKRLTFLVMKRVLTEQDKLMIDENRRGGKQKNLIFYEDLFFQTLIRMIFVILVIFTDKVMKALRNFVMSTAGCIRISIFCSFSIRITTFCISYFTFTSSTDPPSIRIEVCFCGTMRVCNVLFPHLRFLPLIDFGFKLKSI